jgi:serine/threonine protein kinase
MDVKPENIMFDSEGAHGVLKMLDYGSSVFVQPHEMVIPIQTLLNPMQTLFRSYSDPILVSWLWKEPQDIMLDREGVHGVLKMLHYGSSVFVEPHRMVSPILTLSRSFPDPILVTWMLMKPQIMFGSEGLKRQFLSSLPLKMRFKTHFLRCLFRLCPSCLQS